jgi:hypothetical protein
MPNNNKYNFVTKLPIQPWHRKNRNFDSCQEAPDPERKKKDKRKIKER